MAPAIARMLLALAAGLLMAGALHAQSLPIAGARPAAGNEQPPPAARDADYNALINYQLECAGCHLSDGRGARANDVPRMKGFVGHFLKVEGGRDFLAQVPGVAQSSFTDAQLATLLNWVLSGDIAASSVPADFTPYSAREVGQLRARPLRKVGATRNILLERMRKKGIAIEDGLADRP